MFKLWLKYVRIIDVMPAEWALSIVVLICKGKGDIRKSSCYRAVKLLDHWMKVVERVLVKKFCITVTVDEMPFGFMPEIGTIDAVFILKSMHEEYNAKGNNTAVCVLCTWKKILTEYQEKCCNGP